MNRLVFIFFALLVAFASLQPPGPMSPGSYDKVAHLFTYGVFAILAYRLHLAGRHYIYACVGIVVYSGLLEIGQSFIPGRDMSALDLLANTSGVLLGALLCKKFMTVRTTLRKPFVATPFAERCDLTGKQIVVTGCTSGSLGYATALLLADWGANVIVTTRRDTKDTVTELNRELALRNATGKVDGHEMDLSKADSVNEFTRWYQRFHGERLDVLINNAGIHLDLMSKWKEPRLSEDGIEIQWRTNYLGTVHLTHNLLPILQKTGRETGEARVVNVVSQLHSRGSNDLLFEKDRTYESWQAYGLSKLGLIHFTRELHRRFSQTDHLKSYSLHPAGRNGTYTNVASKGLEGHNFIEMFRRVAAPLERLFLATAEEGAQTQVHCATSPLAKSGEYFIHCREGDSSADSTDAQAALRLWDETQVWLDAHTV